MSPIKETKVSNSKSTLARKFLLLGWHSLNLTLLICRCYAGASPQVRPKQVLPNFEDTGGPRILWFLVPKVNHEMRGLWILGTVFSVKHLNGSNIFQKSSFWGFFHDFFFLFHIEASWCTCLLKLFDFFFKIMQWQGIHKIEAWNRIWKK